MFSRAPGNFDASLADERKLLDAVIAAAGIALRSERLAAELRVRVTELRASRARIVDAGDEERRRLERNLHDGAQQRLVALGMQLRLLEARIRTDPAAAEALARAPPGRQAARAEPTCDERQTCPLEGSAPDAL